MILFLCISVVLTDSVADMSGLCPEAILAEGQGAQAWPCNAHMMLHCQIS